MMSVTECIREFCSGSASQDAPRALARDITNEKTDLLTIVEALGEYLANSAVELRCQGTRLLSETLINLSSHQLPQDDVHYLVAFYCDRLKDKVAVLPFVLRGLHAMVVNQRVSSDDVVVISRAIYSQVYNQSLPQGERRLVYTILDYFLSDYTQAVKEMGSEFVLGYIQTMDGEKDPRNLVIALNSVHRIVLSVPFEVLAEDLFEVVACYFPIDFTPPPDDPHVVSKEQLVLTLRNCLTSTPKFTELCLPLMLEKVTSDLLSAKLDSLLTIAAGCHTFDPKVLHTHLQPLWTAIWKEILQPVSDEVEAAGAQCLESMSQSLAAGTGGERVGEFTEMVLKDCSRHLMDLELKLLGPASRALHAVARGCGQACRTITAASVPLLLNQFHSRSAVTQKKAFLQVLAEFINILHRFHGEKEPCPLDNLKTELISLVVSSVRGGTQSLVETGLEVCRCLLVLRGFLDDKEVLMLVEHVKQLALCSSESLAVRERSCDVLGCVSQSYPHIAREEIVPPLLQRFTPGLPLETDHMGVQSETISLPDMSRVLVSLSSSQELQELTLPVFVAVLEQLLLTTELVETSEAVVGHLSQLVENTVSGGGSVGTRFVHKVVAERILVLCVLPSLPESSAGRMFTEKAVLQQCHSLLRTFTLAANNTTDVNESWARLVREVFTDGSSSLLPHGLTFLPLKPSSPPVQTRLTSILLYTLGAMKKETVSSQVSVYLPRLLEQAMLCPDEQSSTNCAVCYASLISKINKKEVVEEFVGPAMSSLWQVVTDESGSGPEARTRSLTAWLWLTKALVMRSHPRGKTATLKLLDLFGDATLCGRAADGFSVILKDSDILNQKNHSITRLMHKQQFCVEVVPELVSRFNSAAPGERQYFLRALSHILQCVPRQVMLEQLQLLHPLLLESLNTDDAGLSQSTLEGIHTILQNPTSAALMSDSVPSLVPRLLTLATKPDSMKVRCSALLCLNKLSKLPRHLVVSYQSQVLRALVSCLDDKKRLVRKEAARTRSSWFMLDTV